MENKSKKWIIYILISIGTILAIFLGIYLYNNWNIPETNIINIQLLAEENNEYNQDIINETIETSSTKTKISPNAIVIEKRYYTECDHLIREIVNIPESLINKTEEEVQIYYDDWKVENYLPTEIVVYKEFDGICNEHYVIKEHNGVLGIFVENDENVQEWKEDTEIEIQYLPETDIEEFQVGVRVVGKINLANFLEDYE